MDLITVDDYEQVARQKLSQQAFDYYFSGAQDEITMKENRRAFQRLVIRYRCLVGVEKRDMRTSVLGSTVSMPVLIAPTAFQRMANDAGETAMARAAGKAGTVMVLSTLSTFSIEDVLKAASGPVWFQLYVFKDRGLTKSLVQRAESAGCKALVLTADFPVAGIRLCNKRNSFTLPEGLCMANFTETGLQHLPRESSESGLTRYVSEQIDASLTWKDVEWLRSISRLPVVIKGIVRADDAKLAVKHGASAIIVSNHGGRQLDTAPATIDVLEEVVSAVDAKVEVMIDGGARRGTDVIKALALGARAVLIGRPPLWGLSAAGEDGVTAVLELYRGEIDQTMALCGCPTLKDITRDLVAGGKNLQDC